jgi:hypothetical protein
LPLLIDRIRKLITGRRGITLAAISGPIRSSRGSARVCQAVRRHEPRYGSAED